MRCSAGLVNDQLALLVDSCRGEKSMTQGFAKLRAAPFYCAFLLCALTACQPGQQADAQPVQSSDVGTIDFPTSAGEEAQQHFLRGVSILHSFGWKQAIAEFQAAQELEPDFVLAYWGESLSYNHPLFADTDLESPRAVLGRLGNSTEERLAKAASRRERGFLQAVEVLWGEGTDAERKIGYMQAMADLYEQYPDDPEVAAFYALSLLAAARPAGDRDYRMNVRAGAIALELFNDNPDHPGAAHYTIHAFDDPIHAQLALRAALRFAEIAPAVSHARHMPTHIFIQLGMWQRVSDSNQSAYEAARDLWEPGDSAGDMVHALDWGHYGDLQLGDLERARNWANILDDIVEFSDGDSRAVSTVPLLRARYIIESEQWETAPVTDNSSSHELLATGLSAVKLGQLEVAAAAEAALRQQVSGALAAGANANAVWDRTTGPTQVMLHEVAAMLALARGDEAAALAELDAGIAVTDELPLPNGSANPVKPVNELYGEVLLELGRPGDAVARFETQLFRTPNRSLSVAGLAEAQRQVKAAM